MFLAFVIFPVFMAAYYGFFRWKGFGPPTNFIGFQNYVTIFTDQNFLDALRHNGFILVMSLIMQGPAAIAFALLLNQNIKGRSLIRVLIFVPYVISEVIVGTGWSLMLQYQGALNDLLTNIGLGWMATDWIADPNIAIWTLMVIISWKYIGFAVILMLAGMQGIPDELYEAAAIDGASYWKIQRWITLPLLGPTIRVWAFLSIIGSLQLFDLVYIIWGQYVASTAGTSTMATYMVREGRLAGNYGYGNAVAVVIFVISLVIALTYQRFVLRRDTAGALTEKATKEDR
jgi:multiple sugar transport system permease protein/raffinose/stachyose/melibiose transport system permease protein